MKHNALNWHNSNAARNFLEQLNDPAPVLYTLQYRVGTASRLKSLKKWSRYRPGVAQRVGRGIALLFHDRRTRRGWVVSSTPRPHFTPGKDRVPIVQEIAWAPGPVWTGGKSRPHRNSIPDSPARSSVAILTELPGPGSQVNRFNLNVFGMKNIKWPLLFSCHLFKHGECLNYKNTLGTRVTGSLYYMTIIGCPSIFYMTTNGCHFLSTRLSY